MSLKYPVKIHNYNEELLQDDGELQSEITWTFVIGGQDHQPNRETLDWSDIRVTGFEHVVLHRN